MDLSPTATRMLDTLPDYFWDNQLIERVVQAKANEIDRIDARIDAIKQGLIPGRAADDSLGLLSLWEAMLGLPINPAGATVVQRQNAITAGILRMNAMTASDVLAVIQAQLGGAFGIERDTPAPLEDTITLHFEEGSYTAATVLRVVKRAWPAHRLLHIAYDAGFILDSSGLDTDEF